MLICTQTWPPRQVVFPARTHGWDPRRVVRLSKSSGVAETAEKAIAEFDKVRRLKLELVNDPRILPSVLELFSQVGRANFKSVDDFVANLGGLRRMRARLLR